MAAPPPVVPAPLDDATLARLGHANFAEFGRESTRWSATGRLVEQDGILLTATGSDFPVLCNGVLRLDEEVPAPAVLDAADRWFGDMGRGYTVMAREVKADRDLVVEAEGRGLLSVQRPPEMVCRARLDDAAAPPGCELRWVTDEAGVRDFMTVSARAYSSLGMPVEVVDAMIDPGRMCVEPYVQTVVAYLDGAPVSAAQTLLSHGIAGVYWVGTVEAGRGRGLGEAVTRAVTNRAFDLGARASTLQASPMGEPIYRRMGYETLYHYQGFTRFAPA